MGHEFTGMAGAALVFAVLYSVILGWLVFHFATRRFSFNSRWTLLLLHVLIRVVSQALGVAFGVLVFDNIGIFIAYLVLSTSGAVSWRIPRANALTGNRRRGLLQLDIGLLPLSEGLADI